MLSDEEDVDDVDDEEEEEEEEEEDDQEGLSTDGEETLDGEDYAHGGGSSNGGQLGGGEEEDLFRSLLARAGFHLSYGDSPPLLLDPSQLQVWVGIGVLVI